MSNLDIGQRLFALERTILSCQRQVNEIRELMNGESVEEILVKPATWLVGQLPTGEHRDRLIKLIRDFEKKNPGIMSVRDCTQLTGQHLYTHFRLAKKYIASLEAILSKYGLGLISNYLES
ncbi:MAG: hypothetical protein RLZZ347_884 [Candidatus Parcubacteria bacterium]|jgi:hypothetical protein